MFAEGVKISEKELTPDTAPEAKVKTIAPPRSQSTMSVMRPSGKD